MSTRHALSDGELYFAYGANLNPEQIGTRCSRATVIAVARLTGHRLAFFGHTRIWDGGLETALPAPGHDLWGVVYRLSFLDRERLDVWQDARLDGAGTYFHYPSTVTATDGMVYPVVFYKKDVLNEPRPPSLEYLDFIVRGAEARGLPPDYCAGLRRIDAVPAGYSVPWRKNFGRELLTIVDCAHCDAAHG